LLGPSAAPRTVTLRRLPLLALLLALTGAAAYTPSAEGAPQGAFTMRGTVSYVVDGDTLQVRVDGGGMTRVRLIGVDTPEQGACYAARASEQTRRLALGKRVVLKGDPTQDTRDRYNRLLAYVWIPGGKDLGFQLINGGFGRPYVFRTPFERLRPYRVAEQSARTARRGLWSACSTAAAPTSASTPTCARPTSWTHARRLVGTQAAIQGPVVDTYFAHRTTGRPTFLDVGRPYPNPERFRVVIWGENRAAFNVPERRLANRVVCVTGEVTLFRGSAQIVVRSPTQLRVVR
jgi:endonuclease YncB( thermonuclease family)